jgi:hypothetical protein
MIAAAVVIAPAGPVKAADQPEIVSVVDNCPVSEGGYRYFSDFFEYRIRVWLTGCPWYHGETAVIRGSLVRTDPLMGPEQHEMTVYCEPGAPAPPEEPHGHSSALPLPPMTAATPTVPGPAQNGGPHHEDVHRPPDNCVLSIVMEHPPVEHARYDGELRYPSGQGEQHETLALDCTNVEEFGGCDPPGSPPRIIPTPPPA